MYERAEEHVRHADNGGVLVDFVEQPMLVHAQIALRGHDVELEAERLLRAIEVHHRRKIHCRAHDAASAARWTEARERDQMRRRDVLVHAHRLRRGADHATDLVADFERHLPPAIFPTAHAARRPCSRVVGEVVGGFPRHRPKGIADHVDRLRENRKLVAPPGQIVHRHNQFTGRARTSFITKTRRYTKITKHSGTQNSSCPSCAVVAS